MNALRKRLARNARFSSRAEGTEVDISAVVVVPNISMSKAVGMDEMIVYGLLVCCKLMRECCNKEDVVESWLDQREAPRHIALNACLPAWLRKEAGTSFYPATQAKL